MLRCAIVVFLLRLIGVTSMVIMPMLRVADAASPRQIVQNYLGAVSSDAATAKPFVSEKAFYVIGHIGGSLRTEFTEVLTIFAGQGCAKPAVTGAAHTYHEAVVPSTVVKVEWKCPSARRGNPPVVLDAHFFVANDRIVGARIGKSPPRADQLPNAACLLDLGCPAR